MPTQLLFKTETTRPPPALTEGDLIARMERFGIGTDATVATHIQKQMERQCAPPPLPAQSPSRAPASE